jgi:hypothetical protein
MSAMLTILLRIYPLNFSYLERLDPEVSATLQMRESH